MGPGSPSSLGQRIPGALRLPQPAVPACPCAASLGKATRKRWLSSDTRHWGTRCFSRRRGMRRVPPREQDIPTPCSRLSLHQARAPRGKHGSETLFSLRKRNKTHFHNKLSYSDERGGQNGCKPGVRNAVGTQRGSAKRESSLGRSKRSPHKQSSVVARACSQGSGCSQRSRGADAESSRGRQPSFTKPREPSHPALKQHNPVCNEQR